MPPKLSTTSNQNQWLICPTCNLVYFRQQNYNNGCEKCGEIELMPLIGKFTLQCTECQKFHDPHEFSPSYAPKALKCSDLGCDSYLKIVPIYDNGSIIIQIPQEEYGDTLFGNNTLPSKTQIPTQKSIAGAPQKGEFLKIEDHFFQIDHEIARGGLGVVYLAYDFNTRAPIAIKFFLNRNFSENCEKYWERESRIVALQAQSPEPAMHYYGKLKLDFGPTELPEYYIALEFINGIPLENWYQARYAGDLQKINQDLPFLIEQILMPLCRHLYYVQQFGIIHRDLTANNIMIVTSKTGIIPIILDWGVARDDIGLYKLFNPPKPYIGADDGTTIVNRGTPPEIIRGLEPVAASDIYMFGSLMYFIFSGGKSCTMPASLDGYILHPKLCNSALPDELDLLVSDLTQVEPADRISNMIKIWESLKEILEKHGAKHKVDSILEELYQYTSLNRSNSYIKLNFEDQQLTDADIHAVLHKILRQIDKYGYRTIDRLRTLYPTAYEQFVRIPKNFSYLEVLLWDCPLEEVSHLTPTQKAQLLEFRQSKKWVNSEDELKLILVAFFGFSDQDFILFKQNFLKDYISHQFHGISLNAADYGAMISLEMMLGNSIPHLSFIGANSFGFHSLNQEVVELGLVNQNLSQIPAQVFNLIHLKVLMLGKNEIEDLSPKITLLKQLEMLNITKNRLKHLPTIIDGLVNLETLAIGNNLLDSLPHTIGNVKNLKNLYLDNNNLIDLPDSLIQLRNLKFLSVKNNKFDVNNVKMNQMFAQLKRNGCII